MVPPDYALKGALNTQWQSDSVPFTATVQAVSPDRSVILTSSSKETFEEIRDPIQKKMVARIPVAAPAWLRDFVEPEAYLQQYAEGMLGVPVTPIARAALPSVFGTHLQEEKAKLLAFFNAHAININVRLEVSNLVCDPILMKFTARLNGADVVVLAGADWQGAEYYDANNTVGNLTNVLGGVQNAFGGMLSGGSREAPKNKMEFFMQGGLIGQMMRSRNASAQSAPQQPQSRRQSPGTIPLGHAKEYGKPVDRIQWGSKRRYLLVAPAEKEQEATEIFLRFVGSLTPDPALERQESALVEQMYHQRVMEAQGYAMQAQQMRMQTMQRQQELSRQIAQNNAEISAGIMDSWEKRSASQSRMSANYSEAVRGVNTYTTPSGGAVECSVTADHVYQNQYGDTFGVSGNAVDPDVAAKLNWTKLEKK